ncbi:MAG: hypothetical protein QNJ78_14990 [Gammaproteobacteria bacterium]|nr:hypothetical protein [Gammaproteobacteria bacterium]
MLKDYGRLNISKLSLFFSIIALTFLITIDASISAPSPKGWTDIFSDTQYGGPNGEVNAITEYNNAVIVAGEFDSVGGSLGGTISANNIAAFDGSAWHSIDTGITGTEAMINAMVEYDGDLIVAGSFSFAGSVEANNIAKWNSWTAGWEPLGTGIRADYDPAVYALFVFDGELYVGGSFTDAGTVVTDNIAKWDGASWSAVGAGRPNPVHCLTEWDDKLVAGGAFSAAYPTSSIAYLEEDSSWRNIGFVGLVRSLTTMEYEGEDDILIAGGQSFPSPDTVEGNLWYYHSGDWIEFEGGIGREGTYTAKVKDILFYNDKLIVTGDFHVVGEKESPADNIAYWQGKWNRMDEGLGAEGFTLYINSNRRTLYVGGDIYYTGDYYTENLGQYVFRNSPPGRTD